MLNGIPYSLDVARDLVGTYRTNRGEDYVVDALGQARRSLVFFVLICCGQVMWQRGDNIFPRGRIVAGERPGEIRYDVLREHQWVANLTL